MDNLDPFQEKAELSNYVTTMVVLTLTEYFKGIVVIFESQLSNLEEYHCLRRFGFCFCINARQTEGVCY